MTTPALTIGTATGGYPYVLAPLADAPGVLAAAGLTPGRCLVVTDDHVAPLWLDALAGPLAAAGWRPEAHVVPAGEPSKSAERLAALYDWALGRDIDRRTPLLALGGGVVGDLAGFAAATLLRGIPLVQCPTSLLAQVDSAIGGKVGVNHAAGKNLVGAFYPPRSVLADPATLATLPEREWTSGLAEVVKAALVADAAFFAFLEARWPALLAREAAVVREAVGWSARIKAEIVEADEHEAGRRALLNFGHTFGHAIERAAGYGRFTHGEAVAVGMRAALWLSEQLTPGLDLGRARTLVARLPLPDAALPPTDTLLDAMGTDKKREGAGLVFVTLRAPGAGALARDVPQALVRGAWDFARADLAGEPPIVRR